MGQIIESLQSRVSDAVSRFLVVAESAGQPLLREWIEVNLQPAPHRPPSRLPAGKMAVYAFFFAGRCLKCGKVGPNSNARYTSQHYNPSSAGSTLSASLLKRGAEAGIPVLGQLEIGNWIKANTDRVNFLLPESQGLHILGLLEAFLHVYWRPVFEG